MFGYVKKNHTLSAQVANLYSMSKGTLVIQEQKKKSLCIFHTLICSYWKFGPRNKTRNFGFFFILLHIFGKITTPKKTRNSSSSSFFPLPLSIPLRVLSPPPPPPSPLSKIAPEVAEERGRKEGRKEEFRIQVTLLSSQHSTMTKA